MSEEQTPGNSSSNTKMFLPFFNILEGLFPRWPGSAAPWLQLAPLKPFHPRPECPFPVPPSHDRPLSPFLARSCFDLSRDCSRIVRGPRAWTMVQGSRPSEEGEPRILSFFGPSRAFLHSSAEIYKSAGQFKLQKRTWKRDSWKAFPLHVGGGPNNSPLQDEWLWCQLIAFLYF